MLLTTADPANGIAKDRHARRGATGSKQSREARRGSAALALLPREPRSFHSCMTLCFNPDLSVDGANVRHSGTF